MQTLSVLLDCYVLVSISEVAATAKAEAYPKSENASVVVGCIFLVNPCHTVVQFVESGAKSG